MKVAVTDYGTVECLVNPIRYFNNKKESEKNTLLQ